MATVGFATLDVIPSVRGLRAQLDRQVNPGLAAAGRKGGKQFGDAAGTSAAQGFSSKLQSGLNGVGGKLFAGLGIAAAGKAIIGLQAGFESSINTLGASADLTSAQMRDMSKFAKQMGASTVFSAGEAADAMVELAKAGLEPAAIKAGALKATMAVAATEGLRLADAATIISNAMTTFNIEGDRAVEVADALAGGSKASTASVASLAEAMSQVGGTAADAGLSIQETTAALAAFDQSGIKGSDAGTSLKTMLSRLVPQTDKAANAMDDLGLSFTDANGEFLPLANIAGQLQSSLGGLSDAERSTALNTIFGSDARRAATALMNQGRQGIEKFTAATSEVGAAQKLADARMSGTAGALEKLKGSAETAGLAFGEVLAPGVVVAANGLGSLADAAAGLPGPVKAATLAFVALKIASAFGVSGPSASTFGGLKRGLDDVRLRAMLATSAFREARAGSIQIEGAYGKLTPGVGRLSASMSALGGASAGAGAALKRGVSGLSNLVGGPLGAAFIIGTAALARFKQKQAEAKAKVDDLTDSLDKQTGAVTESTKEKTNNALEDEGILKAAKNVGLNLDMVSKATLGNKEAFAQLTAGYYDNYAATQSLDKATAESAKRKADDYGKVLRAVRGENEAVQESIESGKRLIEANGGGAAVTEILTRKMFDYKSALEKAKTALDDLIKKEEERADKATAALRDKFALEDALKSLREEATKGKGGFDRSTEDGVANGDELVAFAETWNNTKKSVQEAKGKYKLIREEFIKGAIQMGKTKEEAVKLAEKLLEVPKTAPLKWQSEGFKERMREIAEMKKALRRTAIARLIYSNKPNAPALERASGGPVFGAGTSTSDSIPAWLSNGEFVQRTRAVNYYGLDFMERLNNLQIPKFASGGPVAASPSSSSGGGPGLVIDQRGATFQVADYRDFMQQTQRRAEASNLSGVRS